MTEVFPKKINHEKVEASLQKLVAAFLSVAEDLAKQEEPATVRLNDKRKVPVGF